MSKGTCDRCDRPSAKSTDLDIIQTICLGHPTLMFIQAGSQYC